jgi:hypothetical protein
MKCISLGYADSATLTTLSDLRCIQLILTGRSKGLLGLKKKKHDHDEV